MLWRCQYMLHMSSVVSIRSGAKRRCRYRMGVAAHENEPRLACLVVTAMIG